MQHYFIYNNAKKPTSQPLTFWLFWCIIKNRSKRIVFLPTNPKKKEKIMADQKPFHDTIVDTINLIPAYPSWDMLHALTKFIRSTVIPKNHDAIISALEKALVRLGFHEHWKIDFRETISSVLAQKEAAEKVVKYEGTINFFESDSLMRDFSQLMNPLHGITEILFKAISTGRLSVTVTLPTDFTDIIFGQTGLLENSWNGKLHLVSSPPLPETKKKPGETVTLVNGDTLQFVSEGWWLSEVGDLTSVDQPKTKKITRSEAYDLLGQNGMLGDISEKAFEDLNTMENEE